MTEINTTPEAQVIADLARQAQAVQEIRPGGGSRAWLAYATTGGAMGLKEITDPHEEEPGRVKGTITLSDAGSLIDYGNRYGTETGALFAAHKSHRITAVLDYFGQSTETTTDEPGAPVDRLPPVPKFCEHFATLTLELSEEWNLWGAIDGKMMGQLEFARFLEENAIDVAEPSGADLIEICRDFHAVRAQNFRSIVRTQSGVERIEYTDENKPVSAVEIPSSFTLKIPVYFGEEPVELKAALRWHNAGETLALGIKLIRKENLRQSEFKRISAEVAKETGYPLFMGNPPA